MSSVPGVNGRLWSVGLIGLLLFADGALVGALVGPRIMRAPSSLPAAGHDHEMGAIDWTRPTPSDLRVAAAFGALQREGLAAALDALERAAAEDSLVLRGGHQLAHALGRMAVAANGGDAAVIRQCRPDFASGCYHGVVEAAVQARGRVDMTDLEHMCLGAGGEDHPGAVHECMHGLGHGVLGATGFDLQAGLRDCDRLTSTFASWCYSGAFMEAINSALGESTLGGGGGHAHHAGMDHGAHAGHATGPGHQLAIDPRDPYSPCDRFANPYATECWVFQGFVTLRAQALDAGKALLVCDQAPRERVVSCYESLGLQLTGLFQKGDAWVIDRCRLGRPDLAPHCGAGAARALVQIDWSGGRASRFCAATPAGWKDACYESAARTLAAFAAPSARATVCGAVEPAYVESCRKAAGLAPRS
ncbi:MAG TPA: hypothetical protein VIE46_08560 [Gemmatimonadales bacterium]